MPNTTIKTTGDLRAYILDLLPAVVSGQLDADVARNVSKLAAQVTESFYAEVKAHSLGLAPPKLPIGEYSLVGQSHHEATAQAEAQKALPGS